MFTLPLRRISSDLAEPWPNITSSSRDLMSSVVVKWDAADGVDNDDELAVFDMPLLLLLSLLHVSLGAGGVELTAADEYDDGWALLQFAHLWLPCN